MQDLLRTLVQIVPSVVVDFHSQNVVVDLRDHHHCFKVHIRTQILHSQSGCEVQIVVNTSNVQIRHLKRVNNYVNFSDGKVDDDLFIRSDFLGQFLSYHDALHHELRQNLYHHLLFEVLEPLLNETFENEINHRFRHIVHIIQSFQILDRLFRFLLFNEIV